ncbi:MAG TPA: DUF3592 domain-containing protein [Candidatus Sulfotelmatobacter sp.]|nr:DUF3592 domain-containing protein [Candidatus Sulfotelmatobacter sp.]
MDGKLIFSFVLLGLAAARVVQSVRWWIRATKAKRWPTSEATIESGGVEVVARNRHGKVELPVFAFSYRVGTGYYGGRFALLPYITDPDESIIGRMIGRKVQVRYDPKDAAVWFIPDELIEGCKVEQKISQNFVNYPPRD